MSYQTRFALLGLPLVDIRTGRLENGVYRRGMARGWIAIGDVAFGVLLSVGGVALGGIAVGGLALGALGFGGLALGVWALGGGAVGIFAVGGAAFGWQAAFGGLAVARDYAEGGAAVARHTNDPGAHAYFEGSPFFVWARVVMDYSRFFVVLACLPALHALWRRLRRPSAP